MLETPSHNPLTGGIGTTATAQPCPRVIFGGSGDRAHRKLFPAVSNLAPGVWHPAETLHP